MKISHVQHVKRMRLAFIQAAAGGLSSCCYCRVWSIVACAFCFGMLFRHAYTCTCACLWAVIWAERQLFHMELVAHMLWQASKLIAKTRNYVIFRAMFGSTSECITTLQSWQQMCTEARWFGRALFDAEQLVVTACQQYEQQLLAQSGPGPHTE